MKSHHFERSPVKTCGKTYLSLFLLFIVALITNFSKNTNIVIKPFTLKLSLFITLSINIFFQKNVEVFLITSWNAPTQILWSL